MRIAINLNGLIAYRAGTRRICVDIRTNPAPTVGELLSIIEECTLEESIADGDVGHGCDIQTEYMVLIHREGKVVSVASLEGKETPLSKGDELTLIHRFTGG